MKSMSTPSKFFGHSPVFHSIIINRKTFPSVSMYKAPAQILCSPGSQTMLISVPRWGGRSPIPLLRRIPTLLRRLWRPLTIPLLPIPTLCLSVALLRLSVTTWLLTISGLGSTVLSWWRSAVLLSRWWTTVALAAWWTIGGFVFGVIGGIDCAE